MQKVVCKADRMTQALQTTGQITRIVNVSDSSKAVSRVDLRLANCLPLLYVPQTRTHFFVIVTVLIHALHAAVVHFFAPVASKTHPLAQLLAELALTIHLRSFSYLLFLTEVALLICHVNNQFA